MPFVVTWMDLSEVSQTKANTMIQIICIIQKTAQMNLFAKQKQTHRNRKQTSGYQRGKGGRDKL